MVVVHVLYNLQLKRIYCVREDHSKVQKSEAKEPRNEVVVINPQTQQQAVLVSTSGHLIRKIHCMKYSDQY